MNRKCNQKHLTLSDRTYIVQELLRGSTFKSIADVLHKDPSTISKKYVAIAISFLIEGGIPVVTPAKTGKIVPNVMCAGRPSANIYANIVTTREYLNIAY